MASRFLALLLIIPFLSCAQITSDTKHYQVALKSLRVGTDTSRYFTSIVQTISVAASHRQSPTAKAIYDYCQTILPVITAGPGISITGTYPNIVINNIGDTDPGDDLTTSSTAGGDISGVFSNLQIVANAVGPPEILASGVVPGTYGDATHIPQITFDDDGRATGVTEIFVSGGGGTPNSITDFTTSDTWTVGDAKAITIICIGGGGGGGSGRRGAAGTVRCGGGGGSAGSISIGHFSISELGDPASITVTVGGAGTGGGAVSANDTNGNGGNNGGESGCSASAITFITAQGGNAGSGGTSSSGSGGVATTAGDLLSFAGGFGSASGGAGVAAFDQGTKGGGSGGGGGGVSSSNTANTGAAGGSGYYKLSAGGTAGAVATNGGDGAAISLDRYTGGGGGGGGARIIGGGNAGAGGDGGRAGGGGGGGAGLNSTTNSGSGGDGGAGFVRIIAHN